MNLLCKCAIVFILLFYCTIGKAQVYTAAESAEYDPVNNQWLVSNGDDIIADDGLGNLSIFSTSFVSHGMEVLGNVIYGSFPIGIKGIDLTTKEGVLSISIPDAQFINGLTNDGISVLYAADFGAKKIFKIDVADLSNPIIEVLIEDTTEKPNGIIYDGDNNRLLYVTWENIGKIKQVDLSDLSITTIKSTELGFLDGIDEDNDGNFYVSSWDPNALTKYNNDFSISELVDTPPLVRPADIGYNKEDDIVGIPMGTNVIFVDLGEGSVAVNDLDVSNFSFEVLTSFGNDMTLLKIKASEQERVKIDLFDRNGKFIKKITDRKIDAGNHVIPFEREDLSSGVYIAVLTSESGKYFTQKILIP